MPIEMSSRRAFGMAIGAGALLHALVSFPNHYLFRTYALDLGLYTNTAWQYLHGRIPDGRMFQEVPSLMLADHFDLYLPLFSPLLLLFGSWSLLLVQWAFIIVGAIGVRALLLTLGQDRRHALCGAMLLLLFFGTFGASAYDYHSNVVAAMALPWFLVALVRGRGGLAVALFVFMLIAKENMGLWTGVVALVFSFSRWLSAGMRRCARVLGVAGLAWSFVVIMVIMPALTHDGRYAHFDYSLIAGLLSPAEGQAHTTLIDLFAALFTAPAGVRDGTAIKLEFWGIMLLAGGWALIARPAWGLMALPLVAQKMWHDEPSKWAVFGQYNIEFAPLIAIAVPLALSRWMKDSPRSWPLWLATIATACCTVRTMDNTVAYHDRSRIRFYKAAHYQRDHDVDLARRVIGTIPAELSISAQSPAVPHLALRERLYQFPIIRDADMILLLPQEGSYPLDTATYRHLTDSLADAPDWRVVVRDPAVILLSRVR